LVEINHGVEVTGGSDPIIDGLPVHLVRRTRMIIFRSYKGHDGSADHLNVVSVGTRNDLLVRTDDSPNLRLVLGGRNFAFTRKQSNIVDALENNQAAHAGLSDHIVVEPGQRIRA